MISNEKWESTKREYPDIEFGRISGKRFSDLIPKDYVPVEFGPNSLVDETSIHDLLEGCKSIIVIAYPLVIEHVVDTDMIGGISAHARYSDYHQDVKLRLESIANHIGIECFLTFVDTGPFIDRHLAFLAGLGVHGLNESLINDRLGSAFAIGIMLTKESFEEEDYPKDGTCLLCRKCIEACPGSALSKTGFAIKQCVSYVTQVKGELSLNDQQLVKGRIYGCDICQDVCPHNENVKRVNTNVMGISYEELFSLSNKRFKEVYGKCGFAWRGLTTLKRNALYSVKHGNNEELKAKVKNLTFSQQILQKIQEEV